MTLVEMLKKPFLKKADTIDRQIKQNTSTPDPGNTDAYLSTGGEDIVLGFFDTANGNSILGSTKPSSLDTALSEQANWIREYRRVSEMPEINAAISEIVDEATFAEGKEDTLILEFDADVSDNLKNKIKDEFNNILKKLNITKNLYFMFERFYVDGQLNLHVSYSKKSKNTDGIQNIRILSPYNLYYSHSQQKWCYRKIENSAFGLTSMNIYDDQGDANLKNYDYTFAPEEIVHIDSGLYKDNMILSDLHAAVKTANMLQTLEEMLIPMRFSRSVSRRVFNVDVGDMNEKKADELVRRLQEKFKYKKFYDVQSGTISNQQHVASLTEDYWFPNRAGSKGTTVETIDETGNLGETNDLDYFRTKLYAALKVPTSRMVPSETGGEFDFTSTTVTREELKFFNFITRKRNQFAELFLGLLKRQLIQTNTVTEAEFDALSDNMTIVWQSSNKFFERMRDEQLTNAITLYRDLEELAVKGWVSKRFLYQEVLKFNEDEIEAEQEQIRKEKADDMYRMIQAGDEPVQNLEDPNSSGSDDMAFDDTAEEPSYDDEPDETDYDSVDTGDADTTDSGEEVTDDDVDNFLRNPGI